MNCSIKYFLSGVGIAVVALCLTLGFSTGAEADSSISQTTISGLTSGPNGPVANAIVRVQATDIKTITDENGRFILLDLKPDEPIILTAWAEGYYIGGGKIQYLPGDSDVEIVLTRHSDEHNNSYKWLSAFTRAGYEGSGEDNNCENCHAEPDNPQAALPFSEWQNDAHANSARNIRLLTMYNGTDVSGNQSLLTRYVRTRDYGRIPLRPDPNKPYFGPGYKLDFPDSAGNCAACHTPAAAIDAAYSTDPTNVTGVGTEGVACDFCHKVWDVRLDAKSGMSYPNMPGR